MKTHKIKEYERKKGSNTYNYRIHISKEDYTNLGNEVYILSPDEFNKSQNEIKKLEKEIINKNKQIENLENKLKSKEITAKNDITNKNNRIKELEDIIKKHDDLIKKLNQDNNNNINKITEDNNKKIDGLNKEYTEKLEKLTTLNQVLINGLENLQNLGFIDRLSNKNKQILTKLISDNVRRIPSYEVELKEKK